MFKKKFFCPSNSFDCTYHNANGTCAMYDNGDNPIEECEDAMVYEDIDEGTCWVDENNKVYFTQELLEMGYHLVNDVPYLPLDEVMKLVKECIVE